VVSVYTDFSKAFDRVHQQLLLEEMSVGIDLTQCFWMKSYLKGRIQRIRIGDVVSKVDIGCPTGESSRTIWFINRISVMFDYVRVLFYADDMKLFLPVRTV
jgi:hypothetical protein